MTKEQQQRTCRWCGRAFTANKVGRPREFCRQSCRQADYAHRLRMADAERAEVELIVSRTQYEELTDKLYVLEAAIEDVERDLEDGDDREAYVEALGWVLDAAKPLVEKRLVDPPSG